MSGGKRKKLGANGNDTSVGSNQWSSNSENKTFFAHQFPIIFVVGSTGKKAKIKTTLEAVLQEQSWSADLLEIYLEQARQWADLEDNNDLLQVLGQHPEIRLKLGVSVFQRPCKTTSYRSLLRECQESALKLAYQNFQEGRDRVLIVLPTGVGKTLVMAFAPFFCKSNRVLIITPSVVLAKQHIDKLPTLYNDPKLIKLLPIDGARDVIIDDSLASKVVKADICITNSQSLVAKTRKATTDETKTTEVKSQVIDYIKAAQPDLILIDEGHHFPQGTIKAFLTELQRAEVAAKLILLTATPCRADGVKYDLDSENQVYVFPRKDAIKASYIKRVSPLFVPVDCDKAKSESDSSTTELSRREHATHPAYLDPLLIASQKQLADMRTVCGGYPHRLLVLCNEKKACKAGAERFNQLSKLHSWHLEAAFVTSEDRTARTFDAIVEKFMVTAPTASKVDVLFQCGTLGEGYDNEAIGLCLFVNIPTVLTRLSQFIGRCLRIPADAETYIANLPANQDNARDAFKTARVIMPDRPEMASLFDDYVHARDEDMVAIFTDGQTNGDFKLSDFHKSWTRMTSVALFKLVTRGQVLEDYHNAYALAREDWKVVPAALLGELVARKLVASDIGILDLGCGRDFVFEHSLDKELIRLNCKHKVSVTAVDFVQFELPEMKRCHVTQKALNICDQSSLAELRSGPQGTRRFDVGIVCLALMSKDFSRTLYHAACLVKPSCHIYVVEHRAKFNIMPQFGKLSTENIGIFISSLQKAGFRNVEQVQSDQSMFIFLDMLAPDADVDYKSFSASLEELKFRGCDL